MESALHTVEQIMGLPIGVDIRDEGVDPDVVHRVFDWFRWVDSTFSTYKQDSQISRLNRGVLTVEEADAQVKVVLERCEGLRAQTNGYFDIRTEHLPEPLVTAEGVVTSVGIDPSGLVKGWAVDRAAGILESSGARNFSVNAGGDVRVHGAALPDSEWRVGIQHPIEQDKIAAVVGADDLAIATSGAYARGTHIVDPHTGKAPEGVLSVTIVGPELATADAYATAAFAMGHAGPMWTAQLFGYEAMTILKDHTIVSTRWFPAG
jgi:thiamine biosynthesis lipoprotein